MLSARSSSLTPSLGHVLRRLSVVEMRVRAAVARRRARDPNPDDRFRGLYISDDDVDRLLGAASASPDDPAARSLLAECEMLADADEKVGNGLRLRRLGKAFDLDEFDVDVILIALAPDLDPRFERLYGYLHDDITRRRASIGLALELCGLSAYGSAARKRFGPTEPLLAGRLLQVDDGERPFLTRSLRVPDRVTSFLLGDDEVDPSLSGLVEDLGPELKALGKALPHLPAAVASQNARLVYLREASGASADLAAASAFADHKQPALTIDLSRLGPDQDPAEVALILDREARLQGAALVLTGIDSLANRGAATVRPFCELRCPVVLVGTRNWDSAWSRQIALELEAAPPGAVLRRRMWNLILPAALEDTDPATAMAAFRLNPRQMLRSALAARLQASGDARTVTLSDLRLGARSQNAAGLEKLARRIHPQTNLSELVLPPAVGEQLTELLARAQLREQVLLDWDASGAATRRRGVTALFAGPSGTGKTMAAEAVAEALGLDLYQVDLASVVDKYVGETEKNLDRIFAEAERVNGVLLFDEADALFGKRSDVKDAHDRYANVEVAYLLQRMELFDGVALLATNLRSNLDAAFARRFDAIVDFPDPEEPYRRQLWERCVGSENRSRADLDLDFLARAFRLSGGNIRNAAVAAAYLAAEESRPLDMRHLVRGVQREYQKLGRLCAESEFGPYYSLVSAESSG